MGQFNCDYIFTCIGLCKFISVLVGCISAGLLIGGYRRAEFFMETVGNRTPAEICLEKHKAAINRGATQEAMKPCPEEWLVLAPLIIVAFCFILSFFSFIITLFLKINKNGIFSHLDMTFHLVAGFFLVVLAFFLVAYVALVFQYEPCVDGSTSQVRACQKTWWRKAFRVWTFLAAVVTTLLTGCLYCSIGTMIQRQKK